MTWESILKASDFAFAGTREDQYRNFFSNPFHQEIDTAEINRLSPKDRQKALQADEKYHFPLGERGKEKVRSRGFFIPKSDDESEDMPLVNLPAFGNTYGTYLDEVNSNPGLAKLKHLREKRKDIEGELREGLESGKIKRGDDEYERLRHDWKTVPEDTQIDWADEEIIEQIMETLNHEIGHQATHVEIKNAIDQMDFLTPEEKNAFDRYAGEFASFTIERPHDKEWRDELMEQHSQTEPWRKILEDKPISREDSRKIFGDAE